MLGVSLDYCIQLPSPKQNHAVAAEEEANTDGCRHGWAYKTWVGSWVAELTAEARDKSWGDAGYRQR